MQIFVTGATGFIGQAVVRELITAGHAVLGLARSDAAVVTLAELGAEAHRGDLFDTEGLAAAARACDGVAHLAFIHDFADYAASAATDRRAVAALVAALEATGKPFVSTSGTALLAPGRTGTEQDPALPESAAGLRAGAEAIVLAGAERGVRSCVLRLPPAVHGPGDRAFVPELISIARRTGVSAFVGDGNNRWPSAHLLDVAQLFCLALERAAPGTCLHGVAEEGVALRAIAELIGERLGVPVRGLTSAEAHDHFGWLARFVAVDNPASSAFTRETLSWRPQRPGLLEDMRHGDYF
jgi:nucleoside-diphosphate-sugar epimerase